MKILVFGAKGYLGSRMLEAWPEAVGSDARIENKAAVLADIERVKPDAIVNAAGKTGRPNIDWCETHQVETYRSNLIGPLVLAEACQELGIYLMHLASGCIFYGPSPDPRGWTEEDFANPLSFYSRTKYAADLLLAKMPNVGIARIRMPIDDRPSDRNLINKIVNYKQVIDVENSVTIIPDLLDACYRLIQKRGTGIFHLTNPGSARHRQILDLYREYVDPSHQNEWISNEELMSRGLTKAVRSNCILQSERLKSLGIEMRPIDVALRETMIKYGQNMAANRRAQIVNQTIPNRAPSFLTPNFETMNNAPRTHSQKEMRGVILAGGRGTRLAPLTNTTNKHLLPVADKQMILYPLQTLLDAGIRQIMIVTGPDHAGHFMNLLGSGSAFGCRLTYRIQDEAGGIPHALALAEDFVDHHNCAVILGDNLFEDNFMPATTSFQGGAMTFFKPVTDAHRFGVLELDQSGRVLSIEEKPQHPKSNFAQVGLYVYDNSVFEVIRTLKPSNRGELEIVDVNMSYLKSGQLTAYPVRGYWSDAGTHESLQRATQYFASKQLTRT